MRSIPTSLLARKSLVVLLFLLMLGVYSIREAESYQFGIIGASKTGCGGGCHSQSRSASTVVTIATGSPQIVAGQTYNFTIVVKNANGIQRGAGCDISVDGGAKLSTTDAGLQFSNNDLTHLGTRVFGAGDSALWTFNYTAPSKAGTYHIYAAGNAVNLNGRNDNGDLWNTTIHMVTVVQNSSVASGLESTSDFSVSPNPSTGRFVIYAPQLAAPWTIARPATIEIVDNAGRIVFELSGVQLNPSYTLDLRMLASGTYFLWVRPENAQPFERMISIER